VDRAALSIALARLAAGDRSAQRPVFDVAWPVTRDFCAKFLGAGADAEDAAQRALIRLFEQASDYDVSRDGLSWALEIAVWECRTLLKRRAREQAKRAEATEPLPTPETLLERAQLERALSQTFSTLSASDRAALLDGLSGATWRKRRQRALVRLKALWSTHHE
jgi:RNA polymerase sigma factor (sigma-70 family)